LGGAGHDVLVGGYGDDKLYGDGVGTLGRRAAWAAPGAQTVWGWEGWNGAEERFYVTDYFITVSG
jgi:Ca2+-binding RTX toxin-like protein